MKIEIIKKILTMSIVIALMLFLTSCTNGGKKMDVANGEKTNTAKFETNMGYFKVELFTGTMPITTKNFIDLAEKEFYDGSRFHRIIGPKKAPPSGFMIQGGDPLSKDTSKKNMWGTGGPGYNIKDEFTDNNRNDAGTISMANAGPNTGGSQFFLIPDDSTPNWLDGQHTVFGTVTSGCSFITSISEVETGGDQGSTPVHAVTLESVVIS